MEIAVIPFEKQQDARTCGAAALCMVYRSFGLACWQSEIWQRVARPGPGGAPRTHSWLLCADALHCGLAALTLKAKDPWRLLEMSLANGIRIILNHRVNPSSQAGHYTVLVGLEGDELAVHDPQLGAGRRLSRTALMELWSPSRVRSETTGHVLVAFANALENSHACVECTRTLPFSAPCPGCQKTIPLQPQLILGCAAASCRGRTWELVYCPHCDLGLSDLVNGGIRGPRALSSSAG